MDLHLRDKVFIVTGGGAGIGGAISTTLAEEGAIPVIFGRSPLADPFWKLLQMLQPKSRSVQLELTDEAACRASAACALSCAVTAASRACSVATSSANSASMR